MSQALILASLQEASRLLQEFMADPAQVSKLEQMASWMTDCLKAGGKILSCGNGGSMCDAMHFAEELTGRFHQDRPSLAAIAIADASHLTCTANDYGFEQVFSRYVEGLGRPGDLLLGISTSGNSANVIHAVKAAQDKGMKAICLLGKEGGRLKDLADLALVVPGQTTDRIQEMHIKIIHISIQLAEQQLFGA